MGYKQFFNVVRAAFVMVLFAATLTGCAAFLEDYSYQPLGGLPSDSADY